MASQSSTARDADFTTRPSLTIKRRINAAPAKIYAAWTDPEKLIGWFGVPAKLKQGTLQAETDLRVGGRYSISFEAVDGEHFQGRRRLSRNRAERTAGVQLGLAFDTGAGVAGDDLAEA